MTEQKTTIDSNWLYRDCEYIGRVFCKVVTLADENKLWHECTDAEKQEWLEAHKPIDPEPPHIEDTQADVVE